MQNIEDKNQNNISTAEILALSDEFDNYDIVDNLNKSEPVDFEIQLTRKRFRLEKSLAKKVAEIASRRGISSETYINLVLQEKVFDEQYSGIED